MTENERETESMEADRLAGIGEEPTEGAARLAAAVEEAIDAAEAAGEGELAQALSDLDLVHGTGCLPLATRQLRHRAETVRRELRETSARREVSARIRSNRLDVREPRAEASGSPTPYITGYDPEREEVGGDGEPIVKKGDRRKFLMGGGNVWTVKSKEAVIGVISIPGTRAKAKSVASPDGGATASGTSTAPRPRATRKKPGGPSDRIS